MIAALSGFPASRLAKPSRLEQIFLRSVAGTMMQTRFERSFDRMCAEREC
jgi:hypothetical protein